MFWIFALYAGFASIFTLGKAALAVSEPVFLVGSRMFCAGGLMLAFLAMTSSKRLSLSRKQFLCLLALGFFNIYLTNILEFWALQQLTSIKTCFFYSLTPFVVAFFSFWLLGEELTRRQWVGLAIGFIGFMPLLVYLESKEDVGIQLTESLTWEGWPELAMLGAVIATSYGWILLKQALSGHQLTPLVANSISMLIGGALALVHSLFSESWLPLPVTNVETFLTLSLAIMVISNFFCYNLYGLLLKRFSATFLSFAGFITPFFTAIYGYLFLGEIPTMTLCCSAAIVFVGLFLFYQEELRRGIVLRAEAAS